MVRIAAGIPTTDRYALGVTQSEQSTPVDGDAQASEHSVARPTRSAMDRIGKMIVIGLGIAALVLLGSLAYIAGKAAETVSDLGDQTAVITGEGEFTRLGPVTAQAIRELSELPLSRSSSTRRSRRATIEAGSTGRPAIRSRCSSSRRSEQASI